MKNYLFLIFILTLFVSQITAKVGISTNQQFSPEIFQCMKNAGFQFAIINGLSTTGGPQSNATYSLKSAKQAGLQTDISFVPCRGHSAKSHVDSIFSSLNSTLFDTVWIIVSSNPNWPCSWENKVGNCQYVKQIANQIKAKGKKVGIWGNKISWLTLMGSYEACAALDIYPLWYSYGPQQIFDDFQPFGGWKKPYMKVYAGPATLCGAKVGYNYIQ